MIAMPAHICSGPNNDISFRRRTDVQYRWRDVCGRHGASSNPMLKGLSMVAFSGGGSLFWSFKDGVKLAPQLLS
jgi:hypothetical protein